MILRSNSKVLASAFKHIPLDMPQNEVKVESNDNDKMDIDDSEEDDDIKPSDQPGWTFNAAIPSEVKKDEVVEETTIKKKTDPFADVGSSPLWEIIALRNYYHPGIAHLADDLLHLMTKE